MAGRLRDGRMSRWGMKVTVSGVVLVLAVTLFPYDFFFDETLVRFVPEVSGDEESAKNQAFYEGLVVSSPPDRFRFYMFRGPGNAGEFLANILLFVPFGFGLTCLLQNRFRGLTAILVVLSTGFLLSLSIEVLQGFLPSRLPSVSDLLANVLGTFLGFVASWLFATQILDSASTYLGKSERLPRVKILTTAFLGYATLMFLVSIPLERATGLTNWDDSFPLLIGNEQTGNRPWRGTVYRLQITNRAIAWKEIPEGSWENGLFASIAGPVVVSYQWGNRRAVTDQEGYLRELVWKGGSVDRREGDGLILDGTNWLETVTPPNFTDRPDSADVSIHFEYSSRQCPPRPAGASSDRFAFREPIYPELYPGTGGNAPNLSPSYTPHRTKRDEARTNGSQRLCHPRAPASGCHI